MSAGTRRTKPIPVCANPVCCRACDRPSGTFEVTQDANGRTAGPWHLCSLVCLVAWGRLWTVRLHHEADLEHEEAER